MQFLAGFVCSLSLMCIPFWTDDLTFMGSRGERAFWHECKLQRPCRDSEAGSFFTHLCLRKEILAKNVCVIF